MCKEIYEDGLKSSKNKIFFQLSTDNVQRNLRGWAEKF